MMQIVQQQDENAQQKQIQQIQKANYEFQLIKSFKNHGIDTGGISNNLKYLAAGENQIINIWNNRMNLIKTIQFYSHTQSCRFTDDCQFLYIGTFQVLHKFSVNNQFKRLSKQNIHNCYITNIICLSNIIILTQSADHTIIKTNFTLKQQIWIIQEQNLQIYALDYNKKLNIIASGSDFSTIKLWNGNDGALIMVKQNANKSIKRIFQVAFIIQNNQLISLNLDQNLIIWNINYQENQIEKLQLITNCGYNISLVLQQQYILTIGKKFIKVFTSKGQFIRQFDHEIAQIGFFNIIQPDSMKQIIILGSNKLQVCKLDLN